MPASFKDILDAFEYVSFGSMYEHEAILCRRTGKIYFRSESGDDEEELPDDIDNEEKYIAIPHKNDLDLGKQLALRFAALHLPNELGGIEDMFRKRRAYSRFKDVLSRNGALEKWYEFEAKAQEEAIRDWCKVNEIEISG